MIEIIRTDSSNKDFIALVALLDAELAERDGEDHAFYNQFNAIVALNEVVLIYREGIPIACGAIKEVFKDATEVKRMYVLPQERGKGIAGKVLTELENWALEIGYASCILETGKRQPEAIALYRKAGYAQIPNYGQYKGIENSVCFEKILGNSSRT